MTGQNDQGSKMALVYFGKSLMLKLSIGKQALESESELFSGDTSE